MAEGTKFKIMSVEQAIQRELAYRKNVASLLSHSNVDFMKDLLPLQVQSSGPILSLSTSSSTSAGPSSTTSTATGLTLAQILNPGPRPVPDPISNLSLILPHKASTLTPSLGAMPSSGPIHNPRPCFPQPNHSFMKRKSTTNSFTSPPYKQSQPYGNWITKDTAGQYFCQVCLVTCSGILNVKQHLKGQKHKSVLQYLQVSKNNEGDKGSQELRCDLCQIQCTDEVGLIMHLNEQKHKVGLGFPQKHGELATQRLWCELCQVPCMNKDAFDQHLRGKNHITRLHATDMEKIARGNVLQK